MADVSAKEASMDPELCFDDVDETDEGEWESSHPGLMDESGEVEDVLLAETARPRGSWR